MREKKNKNPNNILVLYINLVVLYSMSEDMNLSINGQSQVPPGFRFHPTEEELLHYYLRKKVAFEKIDLDVIREVDLNKLEPWDIQEKCKIGSTPQNDWYFFSHKDKKYPTGTRTNRATAAGFWKATGRDKIIYSGFRRIGLRKTLVFYKGRAPHGQKSDWIMHEYRLDESTGHDSTVSNPISVDSVPEDGWVVCRVFKKKNYQKAVDSPKGSSAMSVDSNTSHHHHHHHHQQHHHQMQCSSNDGVLDQILLYMGRTCKLENESLTTNISERFLASNHIKNSASNDHHHTVLHERFMHLPRLESPNSLPINNFDHHHQQQQHHNHHHDHHDRGLIKSYQSMDEMLLETTDQHHQAGDVHEPKQTNWVALDRLVASQLNGQEAETSKPLSCFGEPNMTTSFCSPDPPEDEDDVVQLSYPYGLRSSNSRGSHEAQVYNENDLWSFARSSPSPSSSDPLCHLSV